MMVTFHYVFVFQSHVSALKSSLFTQSLSSLSWLWGVTQNSNKLLSLNHRGRFLSEGAQLVLLSRVIFSHPVKKDHISVFVQMHPSKTHKASLLWPVHGIFLILSEILYLVAKGTEDTSSRASRHLYEVEAGKFTCAHSPLAYLWQ